MKRNRTNPHLLHPTFKAARAQVAASCAFEPLEARQLYSVTGFKLVDQQSFPGTGTVVTSQPKIFENTLQTTWLQLVGGKLKINGLTLGQQIAAGIQKAEASQGLSAYDISSSFDGTPKYNGALKQTSSGAELILTFDAIGNETTFTSTTNTIFGSYADPTFHVTYNLDLTIDLSLPSNLKNGSVTAKAFATTSDVTVSTSNILVGIADVFGADIPKKIADGINGQKQDLSSLVPTGMLNTAFQLEAAEGYTHLVSSLDSGGDLLLTALSSTLTVNGSANDHITISAGSGGAVVISAGGKSETFAAGYLKTIIVNNDGSGTNSVDIPSLPPGVTVEVDDDSKATDDVVVGSTGLLSKVAGTVSITDSAGQTNLTVDDMNDSAKAALTVSKNAVQLNGRTVVKYSTTGKGKTSLTVESGHKETVTINSSSTPLDVYGDLGSSATVANLPAISDPAYIGGFSTVAINDDLDTVSRRVVLSSDSTVLGSVQTVAFQGLASIRLGYVSAVSITDGRANDTYDAESSPSKGFFTVYGHFGDTLTGPAASQVVFDTPLFPYPGHKLM
jgi:hypothetical protein